MLKIAFLTMTHDYIDGLREIYAICFISNSTEHFTQLNLKPNVTIHGVLCSIICVHTK